MSVCLSVRVGIITLIRVSVNLICNESLTECIQTTHHVPAKAIHFSADFYVHFGRRLCEMTVFVRQYIKIGAAVVDSWSLDQFICLKLCICIMSNTVQSSVFCSDLCWFRKKPSCVLASTDKNSCGLDISGRTIESLSQTSLWASLIIRWSRLLSIWFRQA